MTFKLEQERIVLVLALLLFAAFSLTVNNFLSPDNLLKLIRDVSVLGILALGMAVVVVGRGVDLSMISIMAISVAWSFNLVSSGWATLGAVGAGFLVAVTMSLLTGFLVAYIEIPSLFATLAMGTFIYGIGHSQLVSADAVYMPANFALAQAGNGRVAGIPMPVVLFGLACALIALVLRFTKMGRFFYALGDNLLAARITGIPVRPMLLLQYVMSGAMAFVAGIVAATSVSSMNTRIVNSTLIYDVILVVVLGGVGLSGGKGGVRNVIVGTLLIGILLNGMTILDVPYTIQNIIKSLILLAAIIADGILNPRDEQTAQQGDI
ncbi:ABC transporter permease [Trinickia violacea]|uniref:ABC transporter permease n=1 Tax=Trinickia violacea TaxID=2571746 RepID=A0A4P8J5V4_9BURK|nr:ABC transporter permease [Trinickia violacea]QCP54319.1 ABC transporter permease [Trinickia violacea]